MDKTAVYALIALALIISFVFGYVTGRVLKKQKPGETFGNLRVDRSDPDGPYLFLELDRDPDLLFVRKDVTFHVVNENYISPSQD